MTFQTVLLLFAFLLVLATVVQGVAAIVDGLRAHRYFRRAIVDAPALFDAAGDFAYQPKVAVIMPCKGVDEKLKHTVEMLGRQRFRDYEVIFAFESDTDAAYSAVSEWTRDWARPHRLVVAGLASQRSQKIHNLLAALDQISADREVLVFVDSDAEPAENWIGYLVAPLKDEAIGATTGYRWYRATGGIAAGVRSTWNAGTTVKLHDEHLSFCWGGSTAMRRARFESLDMRRYWDRALSDDLQMTRAIREAGLLVHFVPQALVVSSDRTTLREFWSFAHRQIVISRICVPHLWRWGLVYCLGFLVGGTAAAVVAITGLLGWHDSATAMWLGMAGWAVILVLAGARAVIRQFSLRLVLAPFLTWRDFCWDVFGTITFAGAMHSHLLVSSMFTRRFVWRNVEYEMISPDETRIVRRFNPTV
ncbi:MAG TPA: glycosyltransferase family 2 protein [Phycisphaerae bacterium]|nr:glycosyltransferase family 2 protein [Phycisphaerae bacterium]